MRGRRSLLAVIQLVAALLLLTPTSALAVTDKLPDLRMAQPNEFHPTIEGGRRLLRFSARILNLGDGPLIIRAARACGTSACPTMHTVQRIMRSNGRTRGVPSPAIANTTSVTAMRTGTS